MSHTAPAQVSQPHVHVTVSLKFLAALFLVAALGTPVSAPGQEAVVSGSQPVLGRILGWSGEAPFITRRGAPLTSPPELGDDLQSYDLIETRPDAELVLLLYDVQSPLAIPLRLELAPESAVLVLGNGHIVLIEGRVRMHATVYGADSETGLRRSRSLTYDRLDLSAGAGADIDISATREGGVLVSARAGRAELRTPEPAVPVQRVFVSPGVGAVYSPYTGLRNIEIAPGADAEVSRLHYELADSVLPPAGGLLHEAVSEYAQYREQFLKIHEAMFRDHALIQDLRRIDRARTDGVPLGFAEILPDGSGRSLRHIRENETATEADGLHELGAELFRSALELDRAMRRLSRLAERHLEAEIREQDVVELWALLRNRAGQDRERLAAAYYAARLISAPLPVRSSS